MDRDDGDGGVGRLRHERRVLLCQGKRRKNTAGGVTYENGVPRAGLRGVREHGAFEKRDWRNLLSVKEHRDAVPDDHVLCADGAGKR